MWNPSRQKLTRRWFLKGAVAALCVAKLFIDDVNARKLEVATLFQ